MAKCLRMLDEVYEVLGLSYTAALSTRPEKRMGSEELWDKAEASLQHSLESLGKKWEVELPYPPQLGLRVMLCKIWLVRNNVQSHQHDHELGR